MLSFTKSLSRLFFKRCDRKPQKPYRYSVEILADIDIDWLVHCGCKGIILDLDNTIVSEDDRYLSPGAEEWISKAKFAGLVFFILSNGKRQHRVLYWSKRLGIPALSPAKKPFPKALRHAISYMRSYPSQVFVIGDSFHTDVMGAKITGCHCIQVATLPHPPRWWEIIAGRYLQKPYPQQREIWNFQE
ncbi:HAD-superfamily hydrolase subfamily IIIA [Calothrix sp. NIES-4101]|nr:HAD-superfamily hydrolase subfamily IIIA [Calothrix sp. NIES-4101]